MNKRNPLVAAAISGMLLAGSAVGCSSSAQQAGGTDTAAQPAATQPAEGDEGAKHACKGQNECKGQGGCAVDGKHSCKGQNECKGQGGCKAA